MFAFVASSGLAADEPKVDYEFISQKARVLSEKVYEAPPRLPKVLAGLTYDQYRAIHPAPDAALWKTEKLPFRVEFLHPGYLFKRQVKMNLISPADGTSVPVAFNANQFDYSTLVLEEDFSPAAITGFAGFRIQHPLHGVPENFDEIGSFVGASYFRLLGVDQRYGISARGLALNVTHHKAPEEFPDFVEYWFIEPKPDATELEFYALLDSPSVTGAYHFKIKPGISTDADITATLYFRNEVKSLGLAPLTSMFWYGENSAERRFQDWRPEVHDSDGLLFTTWNDETVWRPLVNGEGIRFTHFNAPDVQGFGLMQRDRDFHHYEDLSNPYHQTPTAWIAPKAKWGEGAVRLIELPTVNEAVDNIVAFYEPRDMPAPGGAPLKYAYTLSMKKDDETALSPNRVVATRVGVDVAYEDTRRFVIDFDGPGLNELPADAPVFAEINASANGFINENQCFKNVMTGGWRVEFKLDTDDDNTESVELRCFLKSSTDNQILSETWSYQWNP